MGSCDVEVGEIRRVGFMQVEVALVEWGSGGARDGGEEVGWCGMD